MWASYAYYGLALAIGLFGIITIVVAHSQKNKPPMDKTNSLGKE
jgi:hypothetical protein